MIRTDVAWSGPGKMGEERPKGGDESMVHLLLGMD